MEPQYSFNGNSPSLSHYGKKGMKWGVKGAPQQLVGQRPPQQLVGQINRPVNTNNPYNQNPLSKVTSDPVVHQQLKNIGMGVVKEMLISSAGTVAISSLKRNPLAQQGAMLLTGAASTMNVVNTTSKMIRTHKNRNQLR